MGRGRQTPPMTAETRAIYTAQGIAISLRDGEITLPKDASACLFIGTDVREAFSSSAIARLAGKKTAIAEDKTVAFYCPSIAIYASPLHAVLHPGEQLHLVRSSYDAMVEAHTYYELFRDVTETSGGTSTRALMQRYATVTKNFERAFCASVEAFAPATVATIRSGKREPLDRAELDAVAQLVSAYTISALRQLELVVCELVGVPDTERRALMTPGELPPALPEATHRGGWERADVRSRAQTRAASRKRIAMLLLRESGQLREPTDEDALRMLGAPFEVSGGRTALLVEMLAYMFYDAPAPPPTGIGGMAPGQASVPADAAKVKAEPAPAPAPAADEYVRGAAELTAMANAADDLDEVGADDGVRAKGA